MDFIFFNESDINNIIYTKNTKLVNKKAQFIVDMNDFLRKLYIKNLGLYYEIIADISFIQILNNIFSEIKINLESKDLYKIISEYESNYAKECLTSIRNGDNCNRFYINDRLIKHKSFVDYFNNNVENFEIEGFTGSTEFLNSVGSKKILFYLKKIDISEFINHFGYLESNNVNELEIIENNKKTY